MKPYITQRIREAAKAQRAGRQVRFEVREGGDGRRFVAVYCSPGFQRTSDHAIFTGGSSKGFTDLANECKALFARLIAEA